MREGSSLLDRLQKRFESVDSRADRRSMGMRERDSFLSQFSERMKQLERLVQVPDMSAFRRLPKRGHSFDPWGNVGGWSVLQDLIYLDWVEEEEMEEEEEQPRVSAWGTATSSSERRQSSAWLNTPYTPARVAGKPLPKPRMRSNSIHAKGSGKRSVKRQKTPVGGSSVRQRTAKAPTLSPLNRAMGRATVAQQRRSSSARVMNSLPPMLAKTTGQRWMKSNQEMASSSSHKLDRNTVVPSTLRSPMFKAIAQDMKSTNMDADLSQSALASQRLTTPATSNLLSRDQGSSRVSSSTTRGLRAGTNSVVNSKASASYTTASKSAMGSELRSEVRRQVVKAIEINVPRQVSKSVDKVVKATSLDNGSAQRSTARLTTEVVEIIENLVLKEAQSQIEDIFESASVNSMAQLTESTGTTSGAIRRVRTIVNDVVKQIVRQAERSGVVDRTVQQRAGVDGVKSQTDDRQNDTDQVVTNALTVDQKNTIVKRLQSKGVRRQRAERMLQALSASKQDVRYSVDGLVNQVLGSLQSSDAEAFSKNVLERQVRRQLKPLITQSTSSMMQSISKSVLPTVVGEQMSDRVIADVVNEIASFAERETLVENSEGQRQLMNSLERTVSKLMIQTRKPQMSEVDWVDVQPYNQDLMTEGAIDQEQGSTSSPWFTGASTASQKGSSQSSLQPVQQAAARVLKMVSTNPTRPEVIARQTGLKLQEVQQIVDSIQGLGTSVSSLQSESPSSDVIKLISENPNRPEVVARQLGVNVREVQQLTSRLSTDSGNFRMQDSVDGGENSPSIRSRSRKDTVHPLDHLWERATSPIELPEWKGMGTSSFKPTIGESAKGWRLSPKRRSVHPYSVQVDSTVLQPSALSDADELEASGTSSEGSTQSPWFSGPNQSGKEKDVAGFGFVPQTISGDTKLSSNEIAMFGGQGKSVQLNVGDVKGQQARWLQPNRTVILDNGTVIHAKLAKRLGMDIKAASKQNLPLSWTLEGLQLKSDHQSLPTWAKRASGKPQVKASPDFLVALAKASSADDVAEVILQNSGRSQDGILPRTAMTAIDQIRREAYSSLKDMASAQQELSDQMTVRKSRGGRDRSRRRVSRTSRVVMDGLTGLKPISTAAPSSSGEAQVSDKVSRLAKQLESLVALTEENRRDEARQGVRMAEDSHDAISEGQAEVKGEARDFTIDIDALRQEVMRAFEQEMSIRSMRSFENSNNTDPWW